MKRISSLCGVSLGLGLLAGSLFAVSGCGSRSDLSIAGSSVSIDVDAGDRSPVVVTDCEAALLAGAIAPMRGYCSTRSYRAPIALPKNLPPSRWTAAFGRSAVGTSPLEIVVDDRGRSFVTVQTSHATKAFPNAVFAFDADGNVLWSDEFDSASGGPTGLFLAKDGMLRFRVGGVTGPAVLHVESRDRGANGTSRAIALPEGQRGDFAIGRDGSLYTTIFDDASSVRVAKLSPDGALIWQSQAFPTCDGTASSIALSSNDLAIVAFTVSNGSCTSSLKRVMAIDAHGQPAWHHDFASASLRDPAVALDGSIRIEITSPSTDALQLASLDPSGDLRWIVQLDDTLNVSNHAPMPIGKDGATYVLSEFDLIAVSPGGKMLWTIDRGSYGGGDAFIDTNDVLADDEERITAIEGATGKTRWSVDTAPTPGLGFSPFAAALGNGIVAASPGNDGWYALTLFR